jgi:hypothetical protein
MRRAQEATMNHSHMTFLAGDRSRELRAEADRPQLARRGSWGMSARADFGRHDPLRLGLGPRHWRIPGEHNPVIRVREGAGDAR